ncbi:MAG: DNA repair protein RecO [Alphaproteobacteria bacterium MarineAlpha9_Bin7]|nr:MAG: DNA repair protein RecO [Alphaproteobacteria bacterium MarineAlpha9_Bin7]
MDWTDEGIFLYARKYGEAASIATIFTCCHGRHAGLVRGGVSRRLKPILQTGNIVQCAWRARLEENLGSYTIELSRANAAALLDSPVALSGMNSACALSDVLLPEREPYPDVFHSLRNLLNIMAQDDSWLAEYVRWELELLKELGFGLSLKSCAATGQTRNLVWVSPKTGRAVSGEAGAPYADRMLPLPKFLLHENSPSVEELQTGLALTGHFLGRVAGINGCKLPLARGQFIDTFSRKYTTCCVKDG